jgi:hypothetical protein
VLLARALALAAVELIEGERRELRRRRRRAIEHPQPRPKREDAEKPRDVYLAACEAIARPFAQRGFRFARSGPHMTRREPPYAFEVGFGSSHYNVAGEYVQLTVAAMVYSRELRAWRIEADPQNDNQAVAGGWLHLLVPGTSYFEWNVADPQMRASVVADVVRTIEAVALPYFEHFRDDEGLADRVRRAEVPMFTGLRAIEWLLWKDRREEALEHGRRLLPDAGRRRRYARMLERYRTGRMSGVWAGDAEQLAYATTAYGLDF